MGSRVSFRIGGSLFLVLALAALTPIGSSNPAPDFGQPLAGLPSDLVDRFNAGKAEFQSVETVAEGIGPVFNDVSCANCHSVAATGGGSAILETRFGTTAADGTFDPMTDFGGSLIQTQGIGASGNCEYLAEIVPPEATIAADRRTTPLFGLGLVDAVPDATFYAIVHRGVAQSGRHRREGERRDEHLDRPERGRQVRLEVPEPEPLPVLRRRVPERDGHHEPAVPERELSAGRLRRPELQPGPGDERRRHGRAGVRRLHDVPRPAAARTDHRPGPRSGRRSSSVSDAPAATARSCGRDRARSRHSTA